MKAAFFEWMWCRAISLLSFGELVSQRKTGIVLNRLLEILISVTSKWVIASFSIFACYALLLADSYRFVWWYITQISVCFNSLTQYFCSLPVLPLIKYMYFGHHYRYEAHTFYQSFPPLSNSFYGLFHFSRSSQFCYVFSSIFWPYCCLGRAVCCSILYYT